ncbi:signal recognition particle 19 kDa protein [Culicoides brevitarsis]|uniref:signal recognition particle 19 kDa protein n=1 Tax=Culicoides brevitarsis TaxID=469753 RepID=UPI00307CA429
MASAPIPLTQFDANKKHSDRERWICIYPAYINSKKSRQEGRKVAKENAVDNPSYQEIKDVLGVTGLQFLVENKLYPRERSKELQCRGRIRVQIKNDDGQPIKEEFATRDSVLLYLGKSIPQLKSRQNRPNDAAAQPTTSSSSTGVSQKNKSKNKRR